FEMPFNIWCGGCNSMIAKGVRFNAEKKQVGNYYSTKIWSFTMKSACCKHEIVIQTDPKNCEYVIISGAQRKTEDYDIEDAETFALPADEVIFCISLNGYVAERGKLADPFYRLEHQEEDLRKKKEVEPLMVRLQRVSNSRHADDYSLNRALRARVRVGYLLIHCFYCFFFSSFAFWTSSRVATGSYAVPCLDLRTKREGLRKKRGYRGGWALASGFSLLRKKMRQ
ncbi:hypothetical protein BHM03_00062796, partial [Ensete ventricosum]